MDKRRQEKSPSTIDDSSELNILDSDDRSSTWNMERIEDVKIMKEVHRALFHRDPDTVYPSPQPDSLSDRFLMIASIVLRSSLFTAAVSAIAHFFYPEANWLETVGEISLYIFFLTGLILAFLAILTISRGILRSFIKLIRLMKLPHPYTLIACALLALAFAPLPYGYYNFLHIAVCLYSTYLATTLWRPQQVSYRALLAIAIAILYNPIWRITLTRDSWLVANAITIVLFLTVLRHPLSPKTPS